MPICRGVLDRPRKRDAAKVNGGVTPFHGPKRPRFTRATSSRTDQSEGGCSTAIYRHAQYLCKKEVKHADII
jgi:hypothetical protein